MILFNFIHDPFLCKRTYTGPREKGQVFVYSLLVEYQIEKPATGAGFILVKLGSTLRLIVRVKPEGLIIMFNIPEPANSHINRLWSF